MKKHILLLIILLFSTIVFAQKSDGIDTTNGDNPNIGTKSDGKVSNKQWQVIEIEGFNMDIGKFFQTDSIMKHGNSWYFHFEKEKIKVEDFFRTFKDILGITEHDSFKEYRTEKDELGFTHHRFQQYYDSIEVEGGELLLHEKDGFLKSVNGICFNTHNLSLLDNFAIESLKPELTNFLVQHKEIPIVKNIENAFSNKKRVIVYSEKINEIRFAYVIKYYTKDSISFSLIYFDAENGTILLMLKSENTVSGSGESIYRGTVSFDMEQNLIGQYILKDYTRKIYTTNLNGSGYLLDKNFLNSSTIWSQSNYLDSIVITSLNISWQSSYENNLPDLYFELIGSNGDIYKSTTFWDQSLPFKFSFRNLDYKLTSSQYTIKIYDVDLGILYNLIDTFIIANNTGVYNFNRNSNVGHFYERLKASAGIDVHWGMQKTYDYFKNVHSRNSYDNAGGKIYNYVNYLENYNNATWKGGPNVMVYGNGDGLETGPMVTLDILGHEFTHGVTQFCANLQYNNESGALNESFSDIFGTCVMFYNYPASTWHQGKGVYFNNPNKFSRSLENPNDLNSFIPQPKFYKSTKEQLKGGWYNGPITWDSGGVHVNSGVQNYWFYLLSHGGSGVREDNNGSFNVTAVGIDHASKIAYRNLSYYLTSLANYENAVYGAKNSALNLYGVTSQEDSSVIQAWYAVGLLNTGGAYCSGSTTYTQPTLTFDDGSGSNRNYQNNNDCKWLISPTSATSITLSFSSFDVATDDTLIIYNGNSINSPVLARYTGTSLPLSISSTQGAILLRFVTNGANVGAGWIVSYTRTVATGSTSYCNGTTILSNYSGTFTDGSGTANYQNNANCRYKIAPPGATSITFTFNNFNTELRHDSVTIYNGDYDTCTILGHFSGNTLPPVVVSTVGKVLVKFISDNDTTYSGWSISYTATGTPYCSGLSEFTNLSDTIKDASGPISNYQNNTDCYKRIKLTANRFIHLEFDSFDLENSSHDGKSIYDYLDVYDGDSSNAELIGRYFGSNLPDDIFSSGNSLYFVFHTDYTTTAKGFQCHYTSFVGPYCSGTQTLTIDTGTITDGSGTNLYGKNSDCRKVIQVSNATSIELQFTYLKTDTNDAIIVYNGSTTNAPILAVVRGNVIPPKIISSYGVMLVRFISDDTTAVSLDSGFTATYSANIGSGGSYGFGGGAAIVGYEYWYDNDVARSYTPTTALNTYVLNTNLPTDNLQQGLHSLHLRFLDRDGNWSSVLSEYFQKVAIDTGNYNKVTAYEYWYDAQDGSRNLTLITPQQTLELNQDMQTDNLQQGLHSMHSRFQSGTGVWSSVLSEYFQKVAIDTGNHNKITAYEYWYDTQENNRNLTSITPQQTLELNQDLQTDSLQQGLHSMHSRFQSGTGVWSSVLSEYFQKVAIDTGNYNKLTKYEYWYDTAASSRYSVDILPQVQQLFLDTDLNAQQIVKGTHTLHTRFAAGNNLWSSVLTDTFDKTGLFLIDTIFNPICTQDSLNIHFIKSSIYNSGNVIKIQISDSSGFFNSPLSIGEKSTTSLGLDSILCVLPNSLKYSNHYRLRTICTNFADTSQVSNEFTINGLINTHLTSTGSTSFCYGNSVTLNSAPDTNLTYQWQNYGMNIPGATSSSFMAFNSGDYNVLITNPYSCVVLTDTIRVFANIITLNLGPDTLYVCNQDTAYLIAPPGFVTYTWSNGYLTPDTKQTEQAWIYCTVTDSMGCFASDSIYLTLGKGGIIQPDTSICLGSNIKLDAYPRYDCGPFGAPVHAQVIGQSLGTDFNYVGSFNGHYYYKMINPTSWTYAAQLAQNKGGYLVTINDSLEQNFIQVNPLLTGKNLWTGLYRSDTIKPFKWSNCDNLGYTNWSLITNSPGNTFLTNYVFIHNSLCSDAYKWQNLLDSNASNPDTCFQTMYGLIEFDASTNISYFWSTSDTTSSIIITPTTISNYYVMVTQNNMSCFGNVNVDVIDISNLLQSDSIYEFRANSLVLSAIPGLATYHWIPGNDTINLKNINTSGWYKVSATSIQGCKGSDSVYVVFYDANIITPDTSVCIGTPVFLRGPTPTASGILWSTGDTTQNILVLPTYPYNKYWVRVELNGYYGFDTVEVNTYSGQIPFDLMSQDSIYSCNQTFSNLNLPNGYGQYTWSNGNAVQACPAFNSGWYVGYVETYFGGCVGSDSIYVNKSNYNFNKTNENICSGNGIVLIPDLHNSCNPFGAPSNTGYVSAQPITGYNYLGEYHGHHYYMATNHSNWSQAAQNALTNGGYLACINDTLEQNFISSVADSNIWLGLFRNSKGYHQWMNCDTLTYTNWGPFEPTSFPEDYVYMYKYDCTNAKMWNSYIDNDTVSGDPCLSGIYGLLEIEPINYSYTWSTQETSDSISVLPFADTTISLVVKRDINGNIVECSAGSVNIHVLSNPTPVISGLDSVCEGSLKNYSIISNAGRTYFWVVTGGAINSGQGTANITVLWGPAGTGIIVVSDSINDAGCKTTTSPFLVSINPNPNPIITGATSACAGASTGYSITSNPGRTYLWTVSGGTIILGQGTASVTINWGAEGTGSVIVNDSENVTGCKTITSPYLVTINPIPNPSVSGLNSVCANSTSLYTTTNNSGRSYFWTITGGAISSGQGTSSVLINWGTGGVGNLSVSDSINATGCKIISSLFGVIISPFPTPNISGVNQVCANSNSVYYTPNDTGRTYTWTVNGGTIISGQGTANVIINWGSPGTGSLTVTDSINFAGCKGTSPNFSVNINTNPSPVISGVNNLCAGSLATYSTPANVGRTYFWTIIGGNINLGQGTSSINVTWGAPGLGTLWVSDSVNISGCKALSSGYSITVNSIPAPIISGANSVCSNANLVYTTIGDTGRTYNWNVSGGLINSGQGTATISITWGVVGSGSIILTDSINVTGCKATSTIFGITINPNPSPIISGSNIVCANSSTNYLTTSNTGRTYNWTVTGGSISSGQGTANVSVNWGAAGSGTVTVSDSINATGCKTVTSPYSVIINSTPTPVIAGNISVCEGSSTTYSITSNTGRTYVWYVIGGSISSGQGTASINVIWGASGSGTVTASDSIDATGCKTVTSPYSVTINPNPTPVIAGNNSVCERSTTTYSTTSNTGITYVWTVNGGSISSGQGTASISVNWGVVGSGSITVSDSINTTGCKTVTSPYLVTINPTPTPVIGGNISVCEGSSSTYSTTSNTGRTYVWSVSGGSISSGQGTASINLNWGASGSGAITVSDSINATGCKTITSPYSVTINPNPTPVIAGNISVCEGSGTTYSITSNIGRTYVWNISGGSISSGQGTASINVNWGLAGPGTITVSDSVNATGCKTITSPYSVTINPNPTPVITGNNSVCEGSNITYSTTSNIGRTYVWTVGGGSISSGQGTANINVYWGAAGSGTITLSDSINTTGCKTITSPYLVTINSTPTPIINGFNFVCANSTANYNITGNTGRTYVWTISNGTITSGQGTPSISVTWGISGSGSLLVSDSVNITGCKTVSSLFSVTINLAPNPVISGLTQVCANTNVGYSVPLNSGRTYFWIVNGGIIVTGQGTTSVSIAWGSAGIGTVALIEYINATACRTTTPDYLVTKNPLPTPSISGLNAVCENSLVFYSTPANTGRIYTWTVTGGTITSGQGTSGITINWGVAGNGSLKVCDSVISAGCKTTTALFNVLINSKPAPIVSGLSTVCLNAIATYTTPANSGRYYSWSVTKGIIVSGAGTASVNIRWNAKGIGMLMVTDSNIISGCKTTSTPFNVNVNDKPNDVITGIGSVCELSGGNYFVTNNTGRYYNWSITNGNIVSGQNTNSVNVIWLKGTAGTIMVSDSVIVTGCSANFSKNVALLPLPKSYFTVTQSKGQIILTPFQKGQIYNWKFGDGDSSIIESPTHTYLTNGTYIVSLHIQGSNGCAADSSRSVVINTVGLQSVLAGNFEMSAHPNPFQGKTLISFALHESANINLEVFDLEGRLVTSFVKNENYKPGKFEFTFDADKLQTANSVYIVRLKVNDTVRFLRIVEGDR